MRPEYSVTVALFLSLSVFLPNHGAPFAPKRHSSGLKWLVDGQDYMAEVADAIIAAKKEIFITDWQIHPHVHLKRPENGIESLDWRLDTLLCEKVSKDVTIYILLFEEKPYITIFGKKFVPIELGSDFAYACFRNCKNIQIIRHGSPFLQSFHLSRWSHHEKLVVVDRSVAFVGGIDLAFGRWDTHDHVLTDNYNHHPQSVNKSMGCQVLNESGSCSPIEETYLKKPYGWLIGDKKEYCSPIESTEGPYVRWIGMDYANIFSGGDRKDYSCSLSDILHIKTENPLRNEIPRMPWHDVSCMFNGTAVSDVTTHFIQRFNALATEQKQKLQFEVDWAKHMHWSIRNPSTTNATVQVVRSASEWSAKLEYTESSILKAYKDAIRDSKHSIYIENQFFISSLPDTVKNQIQDELVKRIRQADNKSESYHVMIILPLKPEFEEKWCRGGLIDCIQYLNYATLFRGEYSMVGKLGEELFNTYVSVYGLRNHGKLREDRLVTEVVYVHSKLMIVDDRVTIVGSANINDRSMLGNRDSEVNVVIRDQEMINGKMNGKLFPVGKFSHTLRCHLMKEHLGLLHSLDQDTDITDPVDENFVEYVNSHAVKNTDIYERVFGKQILPTDQVMTKEYLNDWAKQKGELAEDKLKDIRGHIVAFPRLFLQNYPLDKGCPLERKLDIPYGAQHINEEL